MDREIDSIRAYRINDMPGFRWELDWFDGLEHWSEEVRTDADLIEHIRAILATQPEGQDDE